MSDVDEHLSFDRNPDYKDYGSLGCTWTNTITGEVWECKCHYNIDATDVCEEGCIWIRKNHGAANVTATEPYIEETYDDNWGLLSAVLHGYNAIRNNMFVSTANLAYVDMGGLVTKIGYNAFSGCAELTHIDISDKITDIGSNAFYGCAKMPLTSLPSSLTIIRSCAFYQCRSITITDIPESVTRIENEAFKYCENISISSIPAGVTDIGNQAFAYCTGITSIEFKGTPTNMASTIFDGCTNLTDIKVPWSEGDVSGAPWGATNATITYNYTGE